MFKKLADFALIPRDQHPGQPAHCDAGFDVWPEEQGFILIPTTGDVLAFPTLAEAKAYAFKALSPDPLQSTQTEV
jgi:hypothetical protein